MNSRDFPVGVRWIRCATLTKRYSSGSLEVVRRNTDQPDLCDFHALRESVDLSAETDIATLEKRFRERVAALVRRQPLNLAEIIDADVSEDDVFSVVELRLPDDRPPLTLDQFLADSRDSLTSAGAETIVEQILGGLCELETVLGESHPRSMSEVFGDLNASDVFITQPDSSSPRLVLSRAAFGFLAHEGIHSLNSHDTESGGSYRKMPQHAPWLHVRKVVEAVHHNTHGRRSAAIAQFLQLADRRCESWQSWADVRKAWMGAVSAVRARRRRLLLAACVVGGGFLLGLTFLEMRRRFTREYTTLTRRKDEWVEKKEKLVNEHRDLAGTTEGLEKESQQLKKKLKDYADWAENAERTIKDLGGSVPPGRPGQVGIPSPPPPDPYNDFTSLLKAQNFEGLRQKLETVAPGPTRDRVTGWVSAFVGKNAYTLNLTNASKPRIEVGSPWYVYLYVDDEMVIRGAKWSRKQPVNSKFMWIAEENTKLRLQVTFKRGWYTGYWDTTIYDKTFTGPLAPWKLHRDLTNGSAYYASAGKLIVKIRGRVKGCPGPKPKPPIPTRR